MIAQTLSRWKSARRRSPLGAWTAWHSGGTSQRALMSALERNRVVLALGGNRSGKTEWLRSVVVAMVLGSDHPVARAYWLRNGCNPDSFPKGPGKGWIIARRSNDSINYHRRQIDSLLPAGCSTWWNKNGKGEARVEIAVPGYEQTAEIVFKSEDQGQDAAQGDSCRIIAHDEEGDTSEVWDECSVRLWDQRGWQIMANTPIKGRTWIYYRFVVKPPHGVAVRWIHSLDNPFLPVEEAKKLEENEVLAAARLRGEFVVLKGRVYPMFSRAQHVVEPFEIPRSWPRYAAIDFGTRNPFVQLSAALDPDGRLVVYREHYQARWVLSQHATAIKLAEGWEWVGEELARTGKQEPVDMRWADPEDPQQLASLNIDHDLDASPALRSVSYGIDRVGARLSTGGLVVFSTCHNTIRELEGYIWRENGGDDPLKKDDHTCDCVRYLCVGIEQV